MRVSLGIDYGGTDTKLLLADDEGNDRGRMMAPTGDLSELAGSVARFLSTAPVQPDVFGMTIAGTLDPHTHVVGHSANLPWLDGTAPAGELSHLLGLPGLAVQDGEAAALAEARLGAGRGCEDVFVIVLGTGVAGAHVVHGRVRQGAHGAAGEVGHIRVVESGSLCSCGQTGCLETMIGGNALGARWGELSASAPLGATARDVVAAAEHGDEAACEALRHAAQAFGRALLEVSALLDPARVVIGGGVARSARWTIDPAVEYARSKATFHALPEIMPASLGVWAGARGAQLAAVSAELLP